MSIASKAFCSFFFSAVAMMPVQSQTVSENTAQTALASMSMTLAPEDQEFRAVAPLPDGRFLTTAHSVTGQVRRSNLRVVALDGTIGDTIKIPYLDANYPLGNRIDALVPVGDQIIGIGTLFAGPDGSRGWVIRIEPDLRVTASVVLELAVADRMLNYFYAGLVTGPDRLALAGRAGKQSVTQLGLRFSVDQGQIPTITGVDPSSGAHQAGLEVGDQLVQVAGQVVLGRTHAEITQLTAGPADGSVKIVYKRGTAPFREVEVTRKSYKGPTNGAIAVIEPSTMNQVIPPRIIQSHVPRAGFQDIGRLSNGQLFGVGWAERGNRNGDVFDQVWIAAFDDELNLASEGTFGLDGGTSIGRGIVADRKGAPIVLGGRNAAPETEAFASSVSLTDGRVVLTDALRYHEGPGKTDSFRTGVTLSSGQTLVAGSFRSNEAPRYQGAVAVLDSAQPPKRVFARCAQSYVFDMATNAADAVAIAGYCIGDDGVRRAALMFAKASRKVSQASPFDTFASVSLARTGTQAGRAFDIKDSSEVLAFMPAGVSGVLVLQDAFGGLIDFVSVDATKAGLIKTNLNAGQYVVDWVPETGAAGAQPIVMQQSVRTKDRASLARVELSDEGRRALKLLGYTSPRQERQNDPVAQRDALLRDITAFQLTSKIAPKGRADFDTEVAMVVAGGLEAERRGAAAAMAARQAANSDQAITLRGGAGPVTGVWRGEVFIGVMSDGVYEFAGEFFLSDVDILLPRGFGRFENSALNEIFVGENTSGIATGLGARVRQGSRKWRWVGFFDGEGYLHKGASYSDGRFVTAGQFGRNNDPMVRTAKLP